MRRIGAELVEIWGDVGDRGRIVDLGELRQQTDWSLG